MNSIQKQPFKVIEIPINKFHDEAIPHHKQIYEQHKALTQKLISTNKLDQLNKEIKEKKRVVRQLKELMYELDTLRTQVEDTNLDKFDEKTFSLRKIITSIIKDYAYIEKQALQLNESQNRINENIENENPFQAASQLQLEDDLEALKTQQAENRLRSVEAIEGDVKDLHEIYVDLNSMVNDQAEAVDDIENNVEDAHEEVTSGLKQLVKASKLKTVAYPVTGALVGTLVGGPLGLFVGFKVGGIAAIGCGVAGYAGGKFFNKCNENDIAETENALRNDIQQNNVGNVDKKEI